MNMKIGYARVSTEDQNLDLQINALKDAGCDFLFSDHGVVWRLDRLGRSLPKLVELVDQLAARGVEFVSLTECIHTNSSGGVLVFHMMAALAQFERTLISERTRAGMAAARARGQQIGRRPSLTPDQCDEARRLLRTAPLAYVAEKFNIHPRTLQRNLCKSAL
jgi:DNA invertase Pin-like site-specific DNA recombinase